MSSVVQQAPMSDTSALNISFTPTSFLLGSVCQILLEGLNVSFSPIFVYVATTSVK